MLVLIVNSKVRPGTEEQAKEFIRIMQEHSRHEPGCRLYIGHQSLEDPLRFCFYEQYDDQAALDAHRAAPYFTRYVKNGFATIVESRAQELFTTIE